MFGDSDLCRFTWRPKSISFLLLLALALSAFSSMDCRIITVDLGFTPSQYTTQILNFGLWSFESPDGSCTSHRDAHFDYSWAVSLKDLEDSRWNWFVNGDVSWTTSRVFALVAVLFGSTALIIAVRNICLSEAILVDILLFASIAALLCEASKLGVFFNCNLCQSPTYWYNPQNESFTKSESCTLGTSAYLSLASLTSYLISISIVTGYACRPEYSQDLDYYDEKSLKSWMHNPLNEPRQEETHTTLDNTMDVLEMSDRSGGKLGVHNRKSSMEALHGSREDKLDRMLDEYGNLAGGSIIRRNSEGRKMDEISAVSWEDEYG